MMSKSHTKYEQLQQEQWLRKKYIHEGLSQTEIAGLVGCSPSLVSTRMSELGIQARSRGCPSEPLLPRFWEYVNKQERGCWEWVGNIGGRGYGRIGVGGENKKAHRISYHLHNRGIPVGKQVNHHCDNKSCVNPEHLYAGTQSENVQDLWERNRESMEVPRGEQSGQAKIDRETAERIKCLLEEGEKITKIVEKTNSTVDIVKEISQGNTWCHV